MLYAHRLSYLPFTVYVYVVINERNTDHENLTPVYPYITVFWNRGISQEHDHCGSLRKVVLILLSMLKGSFFFCVSERPLSSFVAATACLVTGKHNDILFRA